MYLALKHLHMTLALLSIVLLLWRLGVQFVRPYQPLGKVWKIVPHINDTLLLIAGVVLLGHVWQWQAPNWLWAKLALLPVYIVLGALALRQRRGLCKVFMSGLAIACFAGMFALARLKPF